MNDELELLDWKRRIFELYARIRRHADAYGAWEMWVEARNELFKWHPQSPLPEATRSDFRGLDYFEYDPSFRVVATVETAPAEETPIPSSTVTTHSFLRFAIAHFTLAGRAASLDLFWVPGYGGGLFVPFRDETSGESTYGAGRYVLDTIKGADLGADEDGALVLDFNFAYNPSCSYDPRWDCPLTPSSNRLAIAVTAGEKIPAVPSAP